MFEYVLAQDINRPGNKCCRQFFKYFQSSLQPMIGWRISVADWDSEGREVIGVYVNLDGVCFVQLEADKVNDAEFDAEYAADYASWIEQGFDEDLYRAPMTAFRK